MTMTCSDCTHKKNITLTNLKEKKYCGNLLLREIALFAGAH